MGADECSLKRISSAPLPTYSVGDKVYTLREIIEHLESSSSALDAAVREYKEACCLYEAARPRLAKGEE